MNEEKQKIYDLVYDIIGQDACDGACTENDLYQEDGVWKLFLCGFMSPWILGKTPTEVETSLRKYAGPGFGPAPSA